MASIVLEKFEPLIGEPRARINRIFNLVRKAVGPEAAEYAVAAYQAGLRDGVTEEQERVFGQSGSGLQ